MLFVRYLSLLFNNLVGNLIIEFFSSGLLVGAKGVRYGIPNDSKLDKFNRKNMNTRTTPIIPRNDAPSIKSNLYHLNPFIISGSGNSRADIAVIAITIIIIGDTIPAFTAASPKIKAPTIERALLEKLGILKSLSLNISNDKSIIKASKKAGNGTPLRCIAKLTSKSPGNISWLYLITAI